MTDFFPIVGVIRSGKPIYGPSTELPAPFPGLRSYFSFTIILGSRCVGVVTFASKFAISLLQYHDDALREATEAIARAIEFAQNQALAMVLGRTTGVMNALHDLEKIPDWCDEHVDAVQKICENAFGHDPQSGHFSQLVSQLQEVRGDMTKLRDCLDAYRSRQPARGGANSRHDGSVANLVADILDQEKTRRPSRVEFRRSTEPGFYKRKP